MKRGILSGLVLFAGNTAFSAIFVTDWGHLVQTIKNEAENVKRHVEVVKEWKRNYEAVARQVDNLDRLKEAVGNPRASAQKISRDFWEDNSMDYFWKEELLYWNLKQSALGTRALLNSDDGLYKKIDLMDKDGNEIKRDLDYYKRHDALEQQSEMVEHKNKEAREHKERLIKERKEVIDQLLNASTEADIQAATAQLIALNGEFDLIDSMENDEFRKFQLRKMMNEEQKLKEEQAARETAMHNEIMSNDNLMESLKSINFLDCM